MYKFYSENKILFDLSESIIAKVLCKFDETRGTRVHAALTRGYSSKGSAIYFLFPFWPLRLLILPFRTAKQYRNHDFNIIGHNS